MRVEDFRTFVRMLVGAGFLAVAPAAMADDTAVINLTGVQFKNATSQSRSSNPDMIDPFFGYEYHIVGKAKGNSGLLGTLFPNPTDLAVILETLSPGSSALLHGQACNASGAHPFEATNVTISGSQVILGITVTFSATISVGIDASDFAYFSMTNVVLTPSSLVGSLTITEGTGTVIGVCTSDFDGSGFVDTDDFDAFVAAYIEGDISADMDCTGFVDTDDFDAFVRRFEAGC